LLAGGLSTALPDASPHIKADHLTDKILHNLGKVALVIVAHQIFRQLAALERMAELLIPPPLTHYITFFMRNLSTLFLIMPSGIGLIYL
jgi:hypothetical protein